MDILLEEKNKFATKHNSRLNNSVIMETSKVRWKDTIKTAIRSTYPDTQLKRYLCSPDQLKILKLKLAAGAESSKICKWCSNKTSLRHHCLVCPKFRSFREILKHSSGFTVTEDLLTKVLPPKNQRLVNDFLVSISNQVRQSVAIPPLPGARPMPQRGRVQVD